MLSLSKHEADAPAHGRLAFGRTRGYV